MLYIQIIKIYSSNAHTNRNRLGANHFSNLESEIIKDKKNRFINVLVEEFISPFRGAKERDQTDEVGCMGKFF
jgi:hypothetical protein